MLTEKQHEALTELVTKLGNNEPSYREKQMAQRQANRHEQMEHIATNREALMLAYTKATPKAKSRNSHHALIIQADIELDKQLMMCAGKEAAGKLATVDLDKAHKMLRTLFSLMTQSPWIDDNKASRMAVRYINKDIEKGASNEN